MSSTRLRRALAGAIAATLATGGLVLATAPTAVAAPGTASSSGSAITGATFTWGLSGYAQDGIFGPWTFKDLAGNATYLEGDVVNGNATTPRNPNPQTEYRAEPVPATSFPTSKTGRAPNAVKFSQGSGSTVDGVSTVRWTGSYTVNAYPAIYNAPNEIYRDPELRINADGSGTLTMGFTIGAGTDMSGNPFEAKDFGRLTLATFDAGSATADAAGDFRITPDFNGVSSGMSGQPATCPTTNNATGWAGSWPKPFIDALNSHASGQSVVAHFYSTGCGGRNDNKPALPFDVSFDSTTPEVTVSEVVADPTADAVEVTVEGTGFLPSLSQANRQPVCSGFGAACGRSGGYYVAFGKFNPVWQPSKGSTVAPSSTRTVSSGNAGLTKWANPVSNGYVAPNGQNTVLAEDGSFSTTVKVDKAAIDALNPAATNTQYGIAVYPASGGVTPVGEVLVPITFEEPDTTAPVVTLDGPTSITAGESASFTVDVDDADAVVDQRLTNGEWSTVTDGAFVLEDLEAGSYTVEVRATDEADNVGTDSAELEVAAAPVQNPFVDVVSTNTFYEDILWLVERDITQGYTGANGAREYRPKRLVTRGEMSAFLYRLAGSPDVVRPAKNPFTDISRTHTYYDATLWLSQQGISTGYGTGATKEYRPKREVTRGEMAAFLYRLAGKPAFDLPARNPFTDVPRSSGFYREIQWLAAQGISTGYGTGATKEFRPARTVNRGEMAAFLHRWDERPAAS